jgi:lambda repressor-like predicted transcriptional regulator
MTTATQSQRVDPELMTSRMFAQVFQAYMECTDEIQEVIRDMAAIVNDPEATENERSMACSTIAEALFPSRHAGHLGIDLEEAEVLDAEDSKEFKEACDSMNEEESCFADRVQAILKTRGMSQAALAEACDIGQSAISNLLSRRSCPQRRTIEKIARALQVSPDEIWPTQGDRA